MRKFALSIAVALLGFLPGCGFGAQYGIPQPTVTTNIPYRATIITVLNGIPDVKIDIIHDGALKAENLTVGQFVAISMRNFGSTPASSSVVVLAKNATTNALVGTAERTFQVSGFTRTSETWTITPTALGL